MLYDDPKLIIRHGPMLYDDLKLTIQWSEWLYEDLKLRTCTFTLLFYVTVTLFRISLVIKRTKKEKK